MSSDQQERVEERNTFVILAVFLAPALAVMIVGGYGYAPSAQDHITHPRITLVDVQGLVEDIDNDRDISGRFRTLEDERFAVTGGYLGRIGDTLMLVGGHRFDGR